MDSQKNCTNYVTKKAHTLGFCSLTPRELYTGDPVEWNSTLTDFETHCLIKKSGKPNFLGCRIPVDSHLNIPNWRSYLSGYWDAQLPDFIRIWLPFGFFWTQYYYFH